MKSQMIWMRRFLALCHLGLGMLLLLGVAAYTTTVIIGFPQLLKDAPRTNILESVGFVALIILLPETAVGAWLLILSQWLWAGHRRLRTALLLTHTFLLLLGLLGVMIGFQSMRAAEISTARGGGLLSPLAIVPFLLATPLLALVLCSIALALFMGPSGNNEDSPIAPPRRAIGRRKIFLAGFGILFALSSVVLFASGCWMFLFGPNEDQRQVQDAIKQAIEKDPSRINAPFQDGKPPLHLALEYHLPGLFRWLLARGADPNARDQRGQTALHEAVYCDEDDNRALRALLQRGGQINAQDDTGATPLHLAASASRILRVEALLSLGADPNTSDLYGKTPLHEASSPQPFVPPEDTARVIHLLVAGGADANGHAANGDAPLHVAALVGSLPATRALLKEGAKVNEPGCGRETALHRACVFGKSEVAGILLDAGADPNRRDDLGLTPLERAEQYPAVTSSAQGSESVETQKAIDLLRRFGAADQEVPSSPVN